LIPKIPVETTILNGQLLFGTGTSSHQNNEANLTLSALNNLLPGEPAYTGMLNLRICKKINPELQYTLSLFSSKTGFVNKNFSFLSLNI
jgi:hypothetical protein